jgi:SAM-dependent methyltransferase
MLLRASVRADQLGRSLRYVAMGTLTLKELRTEMERYWSEYNVDEADIRAGLMKWERDIISQFVRATDSVLIVGCGTGRDMLPLIEMGCRVTGVEPAAPAVALLKRALIEPHRTAKIIHGYFEDVSLEHQFDVISFSDYCYSLIPDSRHRVEVLRKAVRHLATGGRMLFSLSMMRTKGEPRGIQMGRALGRWCRSGWRLEKGDQFTSIYQNGKMFWNFTHVFTLGEFEAELSRAGLQIVYRDPQGSAFMCACVVDLANRSSAT